MDFISDPSLVLYLPLHELDGASFISKDKHGHVCTVTGGLWTPQGRRFDGSDDKIYCGDIDALDGLSQITVECYAKWGGALGGLTAADGIVWKGMVFAVGGGWTASKARAYIVHGGGTWKDSGDSTTGIDDLNWHHLVGVYDGTYLRIYVDGLQENLANIGSVTMDSSDKNVAIAVNNNNESALNNFWNGLVGEVRIYRRALTPKEVEHNYLATKWRYR